VIPQGQWTDSAEPRHGGVESSTAKSDLLAQLRPSSDKNQPVKKRILVVEDNAFVRECLVRYINLQQDLICCGEADSIATAPGVVALHGPELVLLDLRLKDGESFGLIELLKAQFPAMLILVLSQADEAFYAERALSCGAKGYVMKQKGPAELLNAIRSVLNGGVYVSRALGVHLVKSGATLSRTEDVDPGISSQSGPDPRTKQPKTH
jgi:DNA-binding NarL/FixJ family response regulator